LRGSIFAATVEGRQRLVLRAPVNLRLYDVDSRGRALVASEQVHYSLNYGSHKGGDEREMSAYNWSNGTLSVDGRHVLITEGEEGAPRPRIYLRPVDGSQAVRLGEGGAARLSPDDRWVLAVTEDDPQRLVVLPVGPGETRTLPVTGLHYFGLAWFPDGRRIAFSAFTPGKGVRLYSQDLAGGPPVPFSPEGVGATLGPVVLSPDGEWALAFGPGQTTLLCPTKGGKPHPLQGLEPGENPIRFSADGRALFIGHSGISSGEIIKMDLATGTRSAWQAVHPPDQSGVCGVYATEVTPDGYQYLYTYQRALSELFLVEGLK
jgi:eukaryotic-like serine/threonine-protein kinase